MTTGKTEGSEETCGHQSKEETSSRAAFTTLSTVAIQAGLTQIVASVLKSGSLIHLQLVQFQPGLCEIGSNQEENVILIQEQQQLLEKLQKHEPDVLAVVEKKQQERLIMRKDGRRKQKEEAELTEAMKASLSEGWSLLLRLLRRRLEVLKLASDFFCRVIEFSVGIDRFENVQIKADEDKLKDVWVSYEIIKKDLLGKSLRVLTSSSVLHQKLRQLQRAEALQSRGSVLQEDEEEVEESFQCSREPMLKLEELVEGLQDRRRVADQTFRLQLQEAEVVLKMREKSKKALAEDQSLLNLNLQSGSTVDLHSKSWSEQKPINQTEELNLEPGVTSQKSGYEPGSWLDLNSHARLNLTRDLKSGSTVEEIKDEQEDVQRGTRSNEKLISASAKPNFRSGETTETIVESEWVSQKSALHYQRGSVKTQTLVSESSSAESTDLKTEPVSQKSKDLQSDFRSDIKTRSEAPSSESKQSNDIRLSSESEKTKKPQPEPVETREPLFSFRSVLKNRFSLNELYITELEDVCPGPAKTRKLLSDSSSTERTHLQTRVCLAKETKPESQNSKDSQTGFRSDPNNRNKSELPGSKEGENLKLPSRSVKTSKQQLESPPVDTSDSLTDPAPVLKTRSGSHEPPGFTFTDTKSQQLESRSEKIQTESTGSRPEGVKNQKLGINSQNITETMKSGSVDKSRSTSEKTRGQKSESRPAEITDLQTGSRLDLKHQSRSDVPGSGSQEGKNQSSISRKNSEGPKTVASTVYNFVFSSDLKARSGSDEQQTCQTEVKPTSGSEPTKAQRTGYGSEVPGSQSDPLPLKQHIDGIKQGLNQRQMDVQENQTFCSGSQERLVKTLQDLKSVSELLDLSTRMDLGSELLTSRLLEHFRQAEPHFRQLNAEVENTVRSWESLRGAQLKEKHLSELLKIQQAVKEKIQRSESALNLSNSFHVTAKQLELLLESEPSSPLVGSPGLHGSTEAELSRLQEARQQVQNLLKTASTLRTDICSAVSQSTSAGFQVEQLEVRLKTLDSVCERWLSKAAQCEEELRKQQLTHLLQEDITQLRDSFKELKKRFSNTKFNYLKRNDRTRNLKAVLNQLQQMEVYQEKLQGLRKRVYGSMARLGSEVKNTGVARQLEDAVNELQRQMGQLDKNICEHQKTLNMTCRLQQAIEEYQFWCEEASATIARVGKFSLECRSTEAVSFLHRQFEKFVWPTVPQQEERISQITELAIKLHGVDEGQRYIEKMVSKHSDMVESIRELSNSLMELEAKLKLENLKQQQKDEEKEEGEREHGRQTEEKMKDKRPINPRDNRSMQEDADMHELKETGHTPELIPENDRKEAGAANRKSPVEKSQLLNGPTVERELLSGKITSSFTSTLTSCSPMDAKRKDQATHKQPQPQATPSQSVIGPSFHDNQGEFDFEMEGAVQQRTSSFCGSNSNLLQDNSPYMELHQPEVAIEDFLSNDEYECTSPDDISLPPLAETPESNMLQSDIEEGFCFSSHSVHISQVSHQCQPQSEAAGKDPVLQEKESCQQKGSGLTESGPLPTLSVHSSTRIRSESRSFNPSPSTVAVTTLFTSSLCTILKTKESNPDMSVETPVHEYNTQDGSKDKNFQSLHSQSCNSSDIGFHNCSNTKGDTGVQNLNLSYTKINSILHEHRPESHHGTTIQTNQKIKSVNNSRGATYKEDIFKTSTSLVSNQNIYIQSSIPGYHCTKPKICSNLPCDPANQSSTTPQDLKPSKKSTNTRYGIEQDTPSIIRGSNHGTTTTINEQSVFNQSFLPGISQTDRTSNQDPINPPKSNSSCCSKQSLRTVYPFQKPLTPTQTQKSVHDPSMNPSSAQPAAPHPKPQSNTSSHQANLHGTSSCSPRVLTPSQDPDICPPMAICEEIKLTPQIQGLPLPPAHLRQTPSESLPLGKASESSLPLFTRPRSQATVMEGSPVTLEVEVMGNPEPRLTWSEREEESPCCSDQNQDQESLRSVGISSQRAADKWLVLEALDIMMEDWDAWFGTLCVLLWLVYLILL